MPRGGNKKKKNKGAEKKTKETTPSIQDEEKKPMSRLDALRSARLVGLESTGGSHSKGAAGEKIHGMFRRGEKGWFGGSLTFLSSASLATDDDVWTPNHAVTMGPRQLRWIAAVKETFQESNIAVKTAAELNDEVEKRTLTMVEQALLRVQSFVVTVLPLALVREIVGAGKTIRDTAGPDPIGLHDPNSYLKSLSDFPDKHRVEVMSLLELVLNMRPGVDVWICSATKEGTIAGVCQASDQFTMDLNDATITTKEDLFAKLRPSSLSCYWCGRHAVLKKLLVCDRCRKIDYCSPECQQADWIHFHKHDECRSLRQEGTTKPFMSRYDQFRRTDQPVASFPVPLRGRFQGDLLKLYLVGLDANNCITAGTVPPPRPWHYEPREAVPDSVYSWLRNRPPPPRTSS